MRWAHELPEKKKNLCFEVLSSLILCKNNEPFLDRIVIYEEKWILQDNLRWSAQLLDQEEAPKHVPKTKCTKKRPWSLFGGLLPAWSTIAFWSWQNHYIWEVCSANRRDAPETATPVAGIGQQNGPNSSLQQRLTTHPTSHNQCFKSWMNWATKFCLICHIHLISCQPTNTSSSISTNFCRENVSTTSRRQKILSKSSSNPKAQIFTLQE